MKNQQLLFGICGSFCNHAAILKQFEMLCEKNEVQAVVSENVFTCDTRFFSHDDFISRLELASHKPVIHSIVEAEKVGPSNAYDLMIIAPMSATVAAKMTLGIYDHPVTLAAKAMLRNNKNIVFGIASNDGLSISARNIFTLMNMKHFYVIPFRQDAPFEKERSIVSKWELLERCADMALENKQLQPILLGGD